MYVRADYLNTFLPLKPRLWYLALGSYKNIRLLVAGISKSNYFSMAYLLYDSSDFHWDIRNLVFTYYTLII